MAGYGSMHSHPGVSHVGYGKCDTLAHTSHSQLDEDTETRETDTVSAEVEQLGSTAPPHLVSLSHHVRLCIP